MGKKHQAASKKSKHAEKGAAAAAGSSGDAKEERQKGGKQRRRNKEHRWAVDDLERELAAVGLRIKSIEPDGNCFFRAVLDQTEGEGGDHLGLRRRVMDHIEQQQEHYRLFIEDDEPFERYVSRMRKEGVWAGNLELVAASTLLQRNINVYQAGQPVWHIKFAADAPVLHLSYHDGMHYNSVRNAGDYGSGPPQPLRLGGGGSGAAGPAAVAQAGRSFGSAEVERVVAGTGCGDRERVARVLERCGGDVDGATELLIEQLGQEEQEPAADGERAGAAGASGEQQQRHQEVPSQPPPQKQRAADSGISDGTAVAGQQAAGVEQQQVPAEQRALGSGDECMRLELLPCQSDPERITAALHARPSDHKHHQQQQGPCQQQQDADQAGETRPAEAQRAGSKRAGGKRGGVKVKESKVVAGRNRRCPCGSTRKYKNCCGGLRAASAGGTDGGADGDTSEAAKQLQFLHI